MAFLLCNSLHKGKYELPLIGLYLDVCNLSSNTSPVLQPDPFKFASSIASVNLCTALS
jgi:hypothetical protein